MSLDAQFCFSSFLFKSQKSFLLLIYLCHDSGISFFDLEMYWSSRCSFFRLLLPMATLNYKVQHKLNGTRDVHDAELHFMVAGTGLFRQNPECLNLTFLCWDLTGYNCWIVSFCLNLLALDSLFTSVIWIWKLYSFFILILTSNSPVTYFSSIFFVLLVILCYSLEVVGNFYLCHVGIPL